jgi:hypothetical protein
VTSWSSEQEHAMSETAGGQRHPRCLLCEGERL